MLRISVLRPVKRLTVHRLTIHRLTVSLLITIRPTVNRLSFKGTSAEILITEYLLAVLPRIIRLPTGRRSVTGAIARPIMRLIKRLIVIGCATFGVLRTTIAQNDRSTVISANGRLGISLPYSKIAVGILRSHSAVYVIACTLFFGKRSANGISAHSAESFPVAALFAAIFAILHTLSPIYRFLKEYLPHNYNIILNRIFFKQYISHFAFCCKKFFKYLFLFLCFETIKKNEHSLQPA